MEQGTGRWFIPALATGLYFSQGLPFGIANYALPVYLSVQGVSATGVGLLSTIGFAWTLKVFWAPAVDVSEDNDNFLVRAELPGISPDDISIELESNVLTISGEKKEERTEGDEEGSYHLSERRYGRITRSTRSALAIR